MKKILIAIVITIILIIGIYLVINANRNIDKVLAQFEVYECDGYYDNKNNVEAGGYIVSNKTSEGYRYGYVNYKGKILLEPEYNQVYRIVDIENRDKIYIIAARNGRYGVSLNGKTIISYEYQFIEYHNKIEGFVLQKAQNYGVANIKGEIIIPVENDGVEVKGKHIYVSNQEEQKVFDKNGNEEQIDFNTSFNPTENEKYLIKMVEQNEQYFYGITDNNEKELVKPNYTYMEYLYEDYFVVANEKGKEGIIDSNNNMKLEFNYTLVQKIQGTNLIRTLNSNTNETEIYCKDLKKICTMKNANIEKEENIVKIYNPTETKYFNENGIEINK